MELVYASTRDAQERVTASQAILRGLANDGGLFVPTQIPALDVPMEELGKMSYQETAYEVMKRFLTDFTEEELKHCINSASDCHLGRYRKGSAGRIFRCSGNENHCILSEERCKPDPGEADGDPEG